MTNPYRALIQRLADELQEYINYAPTGPCDQEQELVDEARALLAEPPSLKEQALKRCCTLTTGSTTSGACLSAAHLTSFPTTKPPVAERTYFYSAFRQQSTGALGYFSGVAVLSVECTSPDFLPAVCRRIAEQAGDPSIHDQLILQALTPLDPH